MEDTMKVMGKSWWSTREGLNQRTSAGGGSAGVEGASVSSLTSSESPGVLVARAPRQAVSLWTCSKLCAICFVAGVVFGYTLRGRVRRLASKILKRIKDN